MDHSALAKGSSSWIHVAHRRVVNKRGQVSCFGTANWRASLSCRLSEGGLHQNQRTFRLNGIRFFVKSGYTESNCEPVLDHRSMRIHRASGPQFPGRGYIVLFTKFPTRSSILARTSMRRHGAESRPLRLVSLTAACILIYDDFSKMGIVTS